MLVTKPAIMVTYDRVQYDDDDDDNDDDDDDDYYAKPNYPLLLCSFM